MRRPLRQLLPVTFAALSTACTPSVPTPPPQRLEPHTLVLPVRTSARLDVLFMVDNSPSMEPMQAQLLAHFPDLLQRFAGAAGGHTIDLHLGVVTSDYGAGAVGSLQAGCEASPGGQRGRLQAVGAAADPACQPPAGAPYVQYQVTPNGEVTGNLPAGQTLEQTFVCMASVGTAGCGFEHPLESVKAALEDDVYNAGFLRDDAALVVVFVTNEDDGSAPPATRIYSPDPALLPALGAYDTFRQTAFGVACGDPLLLAFAAPHDRPLSGCVDAPPTVIAGAPNEYDVRRYIDLFTRPRAQGGVKSDPRDVTLVALAAPATPVEIIEAQAGTGGGRGPYPGSAAYQPCASPSSSDCLVRVQHSCQNHVQPGFFGDPAVRLARVVESVTMHALVDICGDDPDRAPSFAAPMSGIGGIMTAQLDGACLGGALADAGRAPCSVVSDGKPLGRCGAGASGPCWTVDDDARCPAAADAAGRTHAPRLALHGVADGAKVTASCDVLR